MMQPLRAQERSAPGVLGPHRPFRLQLLALMTGLVVALAGCGGEDAPPQPSPPPTSEETIPPATEDPVEKPMAAPQHLAYTVPSALYMKGEAIPANTAQVTGGAAQNFSITPSLPPGLSLDAATGTISGTPSTLQRQTTYTIHASNRAGATQTQILITLSGKGAWSQAADLPFSSHYSTSVRLNNGHILVAGGSHASTATALYNPATEQWSRAASLQTPRLEASATLLPDGKVLLVGGQYAYTSLASAEIYDPASNTWEAVGSMTEVRTRHTATLLPDGRVLVTGGTNLSPGNPPPSQTAEIFDPATKTWDPRKLNLAVPRGQHTAQLLPDGKTLLLIGGINNLGLIPSAEFLPVDGATPSALISPTLPGGIPPANLYESVLLDDGSVLATSDSSLSSIRFDPHTGLWSSSPLASPTRRSVPTMTVLRDGRVLLAGGSNLATAEIYNPDQNQWTQAASMATPRSGATASLLQDGSLLVIGGYYAGILSGVERFTP